MEVKGDVDTDQSKFQATSEPRRPTRSANKPSRLRDDQFETQFRRGTKKKVRQVHFDPDKDESLTVGLQTANGWQKAQAQEKCQALDKEEPCQTPDKEGQKSERQDDSSQIRQTRSSLVRQTECSSAQNRPVLNLESGPKFGRPIWPKTRLKYSKMNRHSVRFKAHTPGHKLSRETSRFRALSRSSLIRFRPWHYLNTQVFKKQQQLLRPSKAKWPCKLSRGTFRFKILSRRHSVRFRPHVPHVRSDRPHNDFWHPIPEVITTVQSGSTKGATENGQVTSLHHNVSGKSSEWLQKDVRNKEEMLRHYYGPPAITNKLSSALHSTGAQIQYPYQAQQSQEGSSAENPINGTQQRSASAASAASKGVNGIRPTAGDKWSLTPRPRRFTASAGRRAAWAKQYNGVRHLLLYAHWQAIHPQLPPIIEKECLDDSSSISTVNSSGSLPSCLMENQDKKARCPETSAVQFSHVYCHSLNREVVSQKCMRQRQNNWHVVQLSVWNRMSVVIVNSSRTSISIRPRDAMPRCQKRVRNMCISRSITVSRKIRNIRASFVVFPTIISKAFARVTAKRNPFGRKKKRSRIIAI